MFVLAMLALIACLLLFLREIFLAVSTPATSPASRTLSSRRTLLYNLAGEEDGPCQIRLSV
jgi:hypothetical protein